MQSVKRHRPNCLDHFQNVLLTGGMMKSSTRLPHKNPQPHSAILPLSVFTDCGSDFFAFPPQLAPSAQISCSTPLAWSADTASRADCLWVCMFGPGHVFFSVGGPGRGARLPPAMPIGPH